MNKPLTIIAFIFSFALLIFRVARCMKRVDATQRYSAQQTYFEDCQKKLDTAWIYFKPVADALEYNQAIDEATLTNTTNHLYDLAYSTNDISAYDDEGGYYKKYIAEFIQYERGLTCCYLKKYREEMLKNKKLMKGTSANLLNWLDRFQSYNNVYGRAAFNLHNRIDLSNFRSAIIAASPE